MEQYFTKYITDDRYVQCDGLQSTRIRISEHPALLRYLNERVGYWKAAYDELSGICDSGDQLSDDEYFTQLAACTLARLACLTPKLFRQICKGLRKDKFVGPNAVEDGIDILELCCYEWLAVYRKIGGPNVGGDYTRIYICTVIVVICDYTRYYWRTCRPVIAKVWIFSQVEQ